MTNESYHTTEGLTANQRRTLAARAALAAKFATPEAKSAYFRDLARRSHERRLTLSGDEARMIVSDLRHAMAVEDWRRVGDVIRHLEIRIDEEPAS